MKKNRLLSITIAAACFLMNAPVSAFAVGSAKNAESNAVSTVQAAESAPATSAEPYILTAEDVDVYRCREDDNDSNTPFIDAVSISWKGGTDRSLPKYRNIVIPDTLPFAKPVLDEEGHQLRDEEDNPVTETVEMPVIKAYLNPGEFGRSNLEKVSVSKNIRELGDFADCRCLREVVIPEDAALTAFSAGTFANTAIREIRIPAGITELPERMFFGCESLADVTFAENSKLTIIGAYAFAESGLASLDIPDSVSEFGEYAFNHCAITGLSLPNAMAVIPQYMFKGCGSLRQVTFGSGLTEIGEGAFQETALEELIIPDSVTYIGRGAFNDIPALKTVTVGAGIRELGGCLNLGNDGADCVTRFQNDVNIETLVLSEGLEQIGDRAFMWSGRIKSLVIPSTVKHIGTAAFGGFDGVSGSETHALANLSFADHSQLENIFAYAFCCCSIQHLRLPETEKPFKIWDSAFDSNDELLDADLGTCGTLGSATSYTSEDYYETEAAVGGAFAHCSKLTAVNFGDSLEIINHGTFLACTDLLGPIAFPSSLRTIGNSAFDGCAAVKEFAVTENLKSVGKDAFSNCQNLGKVVFADSASTTFEDGVFSNCKCLTEVMLPSWMDTVPEHMFSGCTALTEMTFSEGISEIDGGILAGKPDINSDGTADLSDVRAMLIKLNPDAANTAA